MMWIALIFALTVCAHPLESGEPAPRTYLSGLAPRTSVTISPTTQPAATSPAPRKGNVELKLRDVALFNKTCGYLALTGLPVTCQGEFACYTWREAGVQGCCNTNLPASDCDIPTTCLPFSALAASKGSKPALARWCTDSTEAACAQYMYRYDNSATLTQFFCNSVAYTVFAYPTVRKPSNTTMFSSTATPGDSAGPPWAPSSAPSPPRPTGPRPTGPMPTGSLPTGSMPTDFSVGAAAGGAVGGALIMSLIGWWAIAKRKAKKRRVPNVPSTTPTAAVDTGTSEKVKNR